MRSSEAYSNPDVREPEVEEGSPEVKLLTSQIFDVASYTRVLQHLAKLYPTDPTAISSTLSNLNSTVLPHALFKINESAGDFTLNIPPPSLIPFSQNDLNGKSEIEKSEYDENNDDKYSSEALDLSTQNTKHQSTNSVSRSCRRISIEQIKSKVVEDVWVENDLKLSWTDSKIAAFNPAQKLFMCTDCEHTGFLSRVAEHWLGSHANLRVFHCPRCPYTSAWSRCVKMHLTRQHHEQFADTTMWKGNKTLLEVTKLMQNLRTKVETCIDSSNLLADKRFYCPHCPYATDRRDLFTRHENIHKDDKPFYCYVCLKQFNRADHVKKHFVRMHADAEYDMSKIRKPQNNGNDSSSKEAILLNKSPKQDPGSENNFPPFGSHSYGNNELGSSPVKDKVIPKFSVLSKANPVKSHSNENLALISNANNPNLSQDSNYRTKKRGEKAFSCHYCNWSGSDNWCLKRHMNTHIKPFACVMCDYKAARSERLSTHVLKVHNKRICNKCNFLSDTLEELQEHTREEHHNNPYSRRHICVSCGMSFDTKANLETHMHLSHTRPKSPVNLVQITPITLPEKVDASMVTKRDPSMTTTEEGLAGNLSEFLNNFQNGDVVARCPHCSYQLKNDEISREHWLTHHEDVCGSCVHVFTLVYGPQLWKKVNAKVTENSLDTIVTGLNKKRPRDEESEDSTKSLSPVDNDSERCVKRPRKQSYPKKVISMPEADPSPLSMEIQTITPNMDQRPVKTFNRVCLTCPKRPKFSSIGQLRLHNLRKHKSNENPL